MQQGGKGGGRGGTKVGRNERVQCAGEKFFARLSPFHPSIHFFSNKNQEEGAFFLASREVNLPGGSRVNSMGSPLVGWVKAR
jgi:hypothetical protein